jgi:hypothetical protein
MNAIIELESELLIDRSQIRDPLFRLLLAAVGRPIVSGAAWFVVDKKVATAYPFLLKIQRSGWPAVAVA